MFQGQLPPSFRGSFKALEADINHANTLAGAVQRAYGGACLQMRLSCSPLAPFFLYLIQWLDCTCYALTSHLGLFQVLVYKVYADGVTTISTFERRASIREFYGIIYPSLQQLEGNLAEKGRAKEIAGRKRAEEWKKLFDKDLDRDDECGICLEVCTKMVLPNCNHAMCIKCYRGWNVRSQSCPFCRGSIKRVRSRDLWVLTNKSDVVDTMTLEIDNLKRFYQYIDSLPLIIPDTLFLVYYDYVV
ncbi:E3 ubiquitin-protein ligase AIRP2-like isoform X2 [Curcuma longa]|uniref:E3 ubiquitin-protein ligase AIRP2-like isoform X2 n=1 Tax=Curcuma longa TaxID=136217 RepID=UPI003D9F173E